MIEHFGLYVILTDPLVGYEECTRAAVGEGVRFLQLRMKNRPLEEVRRMAELVRGLTVGSSTHFLVNDSVALAREVDADGVHVGQEDMPLAEARALWPAPGKLFGLSTHNRRQADEAVALAPDYIGVGPVFPTPTKERPDPVLGVARAAEIIRSTTLVSVAIGGITTANLAEVMSAGAANFAVVRAIMQSPSPARVIRSLIQQWERR